MSVGLASAAVPLTPALSPRRGGDFCKSGVRGFGSFGAAEARWEWTGRTWGTGGTVFGRGSESRSTSESGSCGLRFGNVYGATGPGHFHDAIGSVDNGDVFAFYEVSVDIELLEIGLFFGQVVVVFSEAECFAIEAGERIEKANVVEGIGFEFALLQDAKDFGESDLDEGFLEFGAVGEFGHFGAVFAEDAKLITPFLVTEVILIAAFAPFGEMTGL
jgi:hypothetical protein